MADMVSQEVADSEFDRFCETMELDVDTSGMDEDDAKAAAGIRRKVVAAIRKGRLAVNDDGTLSYAPGGDHAAADTLVFREPTGDALHALERARKGQGVSALFAFLGKSCGRPASTFSSMPRRHLEVCMAIGQLFLP